MSGPLPALLAHDLAVAFKNKTIYLMIGIPLFVYVTLTLVDPGRARETRIRLAMVQDAAYAPVIVDSLLRMPDHFAITWSDDEAAATELLRARKVDGILLPAPEDPTRCLLTVLQQGSAESMVIRQAMAAVQGAAEGAAPPWIAADQALQSGSIEGQTMPTWILMMLLLVAFIVLPAHVAEEKEKQLLLGWLQAPVRERDWLISKLVLGIALCLLAVLVLQATGEAVSWSYPVSYLLMVVAGGFCFGALGICLGLLCRNQASARTLGLLCYLPMLLPAALSDMSPELRRIAPWVPSYHLYEPIRVMLVEDRRPVLFLVATWLSLIAIGLLACLASHWLIRKRWLM